MYSTPRNSATGSFVTCPATVLTPSAIAESRSAAPAGPCSATYWMYGSVAFVRAYVLVFGTAPGMLPTA